MAVPGKCFVNGDSKVLCFGCFLEYLTVDLVCSLDDLPFIGDSDVLTLVRVKVHLPVPLPLLKVVKIFL